jgi:hypothetical protein
VVVAREGEEVAHAFNVVHTSVGVVFLDGQSGDLAELPADPGGLLLLWTAGEPATGTQMHTSELVAKGSGGPRGVTAVARALAKCRLVR